MGNHTNGTTSGPGGPSTTFWEVLRDFVSGSGNLLKFLAIVVVAYLIGHALQLLYVKLQRGKPTSAHLLAGKTLMLIVVLGGAWLGIEYAFSVDAIGLFATLGIVSLALGFGLQNTVANVAAGVSLSLDKPFDVGDRIRVGTTWGDVISIGFRSTAIRTTAGEHVVIPNAILDTQEVWNYTSSSRAELRLEVPFQISYGSSITLAEDIALRIARDAPGVLAYPEPKVMVRGFGSDGVDLEVRCWLGNPEDKARVQDYVLRRIKHRFDEGGVHFPFPQRTVSYLKEQEPPSPTPEHLTEEHASKPVILAIIRSPLTAATTPAHMVAFAKSTDSRIVFLHVRPPQAAMHPGHGQIALNQCVQEARRQNVPCQGRMEVGQTAALTAQVARQEGAKVLLMMRLGAQGIGRGWLRAEQRAIQKASPIPVQFLDSDEPPSQKATKFWHDKLHPAPDPEPPEPAA